MAGENNNHLEMSDEDFLKISPSSLEEQSASSASSSEKTEETTEVAENTDEPANGTAGSDKPDEQSDNPDNTQTDPNKSEPAKAEPEAEKTKAKPDGKQPEPKADTDPAKAKPEGEAKPDDKAKPTPKTDEAKPTETQVDYKAFYDTLVGKPIKANGKEITLKTPEEVVRMVQMGAGYGRKLQELQPALKTLRMLEKNNLMNENEISFLIDLKNKQPEAIKKLIKDSGIDPLDLNMQDNAEYKPTDHSVSDKEIHFKNALDDLTASPDGQETLKIINTTWDQPSKTALWESPELLQVFQSQRESGIYDQITAEIDRQKTLGTIPHNTPFIQAYKAAGDALVAANALGPTPTQPAKSAPEPKVLETRRANPKQPSNSDAARAASPTQSASTTKGGTVNPLDMADDEFLKSFKL